MIFEPEDRTQSELGIISETFFAPEMATKKAASLRMLLLWFFVCLSFEGDFLPTSSTLASSKEEMLKPTERRKRGTKTLDATKNKRAAGNGLVCSKIENQNSEICSKV